MLQNTSRQKTGEENGSAHEKRQKQDGSKELRKRIIRRPTCQSPEMSPAQKGASAAEHYRVVRNRRGRGCPVFSCVATETN